MFRSLPGLVFISIVILVIPRTGYSLEEILAPTKTSPLEERKVSPYTPDCHRFRLIVKRSSRRLGFVAFDSDRDTVLATDPHRAQIFTFDSNGDLRADQALVGSRELAAKRGWGPIKRHTRPRKETAVWQVDASDDTMHLRAAKYTYGNGEAIFCYSRQPDFGIESVIFGQYAAAVPSSFKCHTITLKAQCVDRRHNPSDTPDPPYKTSKLEERDESLWQAGRRNVYI